MLESFFFSFQGQYVYEESYCSNATQQMFQPPGEYKNTIRVFDDKNRTVYQVNTYFLL
jgi:hypothetical protein